MSFKRCEHVLGQGVTAVTVKGTFALHAGLVLAILELELNWN